jgi:Fe/S biogenesis protein NfuA
MITFTDQARDVVISFMAESEGELEALRITLRESRSGSKPNFDLTLVRKDEQTDEERVVEAGADGFTVLIDEAHVSRLEGATVDYVERVNESGFEVRLVEDDGDAPAVTSPPEGPIADRVREVLDANVNPAIAAHGGMISLVNVVDTDVYLEMSGGCQGCALSLATLRQGVERMLREAVPELTAVHDVTDHASGENPYL